MILNKTIDEQLNMLTEAIRVKRKERKMTQSQMAKRLNMSQNSYFKIEKRKTRLDFYRLLQISDVLSIDVFDVLNVLKDDTTKNPSLS